MPHQQQLSTVCFDSNSLQRQCHKKWQMHWLTVSQCADWIKCSWWIKCCEKHESNVFCFIFTTSTLAVTMIAFFSHPSKPQYFEVTHVCVLIEQPTIQRICLTHENIHLRIYRIVQMLDFSFIWDIAGEILYLRVASGTFHLCMYY